MIDKAIVFLHQQINQYLKLNLGDGNLEEFIVLSNILKQDGSAATAGDSLIMTLINLEEESTMREAVNYISSGEDHGAVNPSLHLKMHLLISADYTDYKEGLKSLSLVLRFFQSQNVFNSESSEELEAGGVQKMIIKLCKVPFEKQNHIWGTIGAKYIPSVIYQVTMVSVQENKILERIPSSKSVDNQISSN